MNERAIEQFIRYIKSLMIIDTPVTTLVVKRAYLIMVIKSHATVSLYEFYSIAESLTGSPVQRSFNPYTKQYDKIPINGDPYANESRLERNIRKMGNRIVPSLNNIADDTDLILEFLKDPRVNITMGDNAATKWAIGKNNMVVAKYLLSKSDVINTVQMYVLLKHACSIDSPDMVNMLIDDFNVDVSRRNSIRVRMAIRDQRLDIFKALISSPKFFINDSISDLFYVAIALEDSIYFDILIGCEGLDFNNNDYDLVSSAIYNNNKYAVSVLLRITDIVSNLPLGTKNSLIEKKFIPSYKSRKINNTL